VALDFGQGGASELLNLETFKSKVYDVKNRFIKVNRVMIPDSEIEPAGVATCGHSRRCKIPDFFWGAWERYLRLFDSGISSPILN
jgi:hypothetical protein